MRWVGLFWKVYLGVGVVLILFWIARLLFSTERKLYLPLLPVIAIWPLALLHPRGRRMLGNIINGFSNSNTF